MVTCHFLEVNVENYRELSDTSTIITDVDVLGVAFDITGKTRKIIFDCKTLKNTSPINRAFWASGVMNFLGYDEAFIILRKRKQVRPIDFPQKQLMSTFLMKIK